MAHAWTYETAASYWSANRDNPEGLWDAFESAEAYLLDHAPRSLPEAVRMIDVLAEQGGDRRTDGRDVEALERIQTFLQRLADHAPVRSRTAGATNGRGPRDAAAIPA